MLFSSTFESDIYATKNVYDLIARCYIELLNNWSYPDEYFFEWCDRHIESLPGFSQISRHFDDLYIKIFGLAIKLLPNSFPKFRVCFLNTLKLIPDLPRIFPLSGADERKVAAICMGKSILALDQYEREDFENRKMDVTLPPITGPLNQCH